MSESGDEEQAPPPPPGDVETAQIEDPPPAPPPTEPEETSKDAEKDDETVVEKKEEKEKSSKDKSKDKSRDRDRGRRRRRRSRSRDRGRRRRSRSRDRGRGRRRSRSREGRRRKRKRSPDEEKREKKKKKKESKKEKVKVKAETKEEPKEEEALMTDAQIEAKKQKQAREKKEAQIKAAAEFANLGVNAEITRPARKLYVGNLPTDMGLTEKMLVQFFTACLEGLGVETEVPIMSAWINGDQTFAFLEFRGVQDATLALSLCDGLALGGRQLRFGRPVDYKLPAKHLLCYLVGGNEPVGDIEVPYTMPAVRDGTPAHNLALALMRQETGEDPGAPVILTAATRADVSRVLVLENCVSEAMIAKNEEYIDVIEDIKEECDNWGKLLQIIIPRRGQDACGFNRVFLRYEKQSDADRCKSKTQGREFGDSEGIVCKYFPENQFKTGVWDAEPLEERRMDVLPPMSGPPPLPPATDDGPPPPIPAFEDMAMDDGGDDIVEVDMEVA